MIFVLGQIRCNPTSLFIFMRPTPGSESTSETSLEKDQSLSQGRLLAGSRELEDHSPPASLTSSLAQVLSLSSFWRLVCLHVPLFIALRLQGSLGVGKASVVCGVWNGEAAWMGSTKRQNQKKASLEACSCPPGDSEFWGV